MDLGGEIWFKVINVVNNIVTDRVWTISDLSWKKDQHQHED